MILAPMQGLTEILFRRVYEECFPGAIRLAISPFISLTRGNLSEAWKKIDDVLPDANRGSIPVIPQILGREAEEFVELGNRLCDLGYEELNWNIGCPMRAITGKHRGSGILPYPDEVRSLLEAVVPRLRPRLSVKMRLGLRDKEEIYSLIPVLNDFPLASVTIHPRTGRQQYTGTADREAFGAVAPLIKAPVIYNGDICTPDDAHTILERFPYVDDIMVGRGVIYSPTLPLEIAGQRLDEEQKRRESCRFIRKLLTEIEATMPTEQARIRKTKEYWSLMWHALPLTETQARMVLREQDFETVKKMIYQHTQ